MSKSNFCGESESKSEFSLVSKIKAEKALGLSADSKIKNSAYIQGAEADTKKCAVQLKKKRGGSNQTSTDDGPLPITEFTEDSVECTPAQKSNILANPRQGPIRDKNGEQYYHIKGRYPCQGKPIWVITDDGKIKIVGMYTHVDDHNCKPPIWTQ